MPKKHYSEGPSRYSLLGTASTVGLHLVSAPAVGALLGYGADKILGSWPVGSAIGLFLGIAAGFHMVWKDFRYLQRNEEFLDEPSPQSSPRSVDHNLPEKTASSAPTDDETGSDKN